MPKKKERFCVLCSCKDHSDMPKGLQRHWHCPILKDNICEVDCHIELEAGLGAQDLLETVCKKSDVTPQEVFATCMACPHGGKQLTKGGDKRKLKWLSGDAPKSVIRRLNVQRGFKI